MIKMKQIIPFKKELLFKTKVQEITSISLEHVLNQKNEDAISGDFHLSGDYKMTETSINREKFSFKIPFEIALDNKYELDSITIDIDNFYYEVVNNESLMVNIDLYVEGERKEIIPPKIEEVKQEQKTIIEEEPTLEEIATDPEERTNQTKQEEIKKQIAEELNESSKEIKSDQDEDGFNRELAFPEKLEKMEDFLTKEDSFQEDIETSKPTIIENKNEFNIFENIDNSDTYVTYHIYIVKNEDNIDNICTKYKVSKEDIALYNNIEEIKPGTKLIIPNQDE